MLVMSLSLTPQPFRRHKYSLLCYPIYSNKKDWNQHKYTVVALALRYQWLRFSELLAVRIQKHLQTIVVQSGQNFENL